MKNIVLLSLTLFAIDGYTHEIKFENQILVPKAKSKCEVVFHEKAIVGVYCPAKTKASDMIFDLMEIAKVTTWPLPVFEVFNDMKKMPKSIKEYNGLADKVSFQTYTIQITNQKIVEKQCYKNAKDIKCDFN